MENDGNIDREKVIEEFNRRAVRCGDLNAVLDAGNRPGIARHNLLRDNFTWHALMHLLAPKPQDTILDFGCGVGRLTWRLRGKVKQAVGVDVSPAMIQVAMKQNPENQQISFVLLTQGEWPFQPDFFSKIFTVWVLQHVNENDLHAIAACFFSALAKGGSVILMEQVKPTRKLLSDIHVHRSCQDYIHIFEKAGFVSKTQKPVMRVPSYTMWLWNRFAWMTPAFFPLLRCLEKLTLLRKKENVDYFTWGFVFTKP